MIKREFSSLHCSRKSPERKQTTGFGKIDQQITRMHVLPSEAGRSVMKSTPRCDHGRLGMGRGKSLQDGKWRGVFEVAQSGQP